MNKDFLVVFEKGKTGYGAFAPDIAGCFATGTSLGEVRLRFCDAVAAHLDWMARDGDPMPEPTTTAFDFARKPGTESSTYYVEWLSVTIPAPRATQAA